MKQVEAAIKKHRLPALGRRGMLACTTRYEKRLLYTTVDKTETASSSDAIRANTAPGQERNQPNINDVAEN